MAKVGYIFAADTLESLEQDKTWMNDYGCIRIVEEKAENEKSRPEWRTLLMALERGDEIVISKFSNNFNVGICSIFNNIKDIEFDIS